MIADTVPDRYRLSHRLDGSETARTRGLKLVALLQSASNDGMPALIDGGRGTVHEVAPPEGDVTLRRHDLTVIGDGAALSLHTRLALRAPLSASGVALREDAAWKSAAIRVTQPRPVAVGDVIVLRTQTPVCTTYRNYHKQAVSQVAAISGDVLTLAHALPFHFTAAETVLTFLSPRAVQATGLDIRTDAGGRFDLNGLAGSVLRDCRFAAGGKTSADPLFLSRALDTRFDNVTVRDARYGMNISNGSRNTRIEGIRAWNCRHPVDPNVWAYGVHVRDFSFHDTHGSIQAHPSFEVHYERGVTDSGYGNRTIGGSVREARFVNAQPIPEEASQTFIGLLPDYAYLRADQTQLVENVDAPSVNFLFSEGRLGTLRNVRMDYYRNDGQGYGVDRLHVHDDCTIERHIRNAVRRTRKWQVAAPIPQRTRPVFAEAGPPLDFRGHARGGDVTLSLPGHGLENGDSLRFERIDGGAEAGAGLVGRWSRVSVLDPDTLRPEGLDAAAAEALRAGGVATPGRAVQYCDPTEAANNQIVGDYPCFWLRTQILQGNLRRLPSPDAGVAPDQPRRVRIRLATSTFEDANANAHRHGELVVTVSGLFDGFAQSRVRFWQKQNVGVLFSQPEPLVGIGAADLVLSDLSGVDLGLKTGLDAIEFVWSVPGWTGGSTVNMAEAEVKFFPARPAPVG